MRPRVPVGGGLGARLDRYDGAFLVLVIVAFFAVAGLAVGVVASGAGSPVVAHRRSASVASSYFASVACFAPHTCLAVGPQGGRESAVWATDDGTGQHWWLRALIPGRAVDVSCSGRASCAVVDFTVPSLTPAVLWSSDEGRHWQRRGTLPWLVRGNVSDISCPAPSTCAVAGEPPVVDGRQGLVVTDDGGRHWDSVRPHISDESSVVCPTPRVCYLWGNERNKAAILRYRLTGRQARLTSRQVFPALGYIWGMGCDAGSMCAGVTEHDKRTSSGLYLSQFRSLLTTNGGSRWRASPGTWPSGGSWSIACPSAQICVAAVLGDSNPQERVVLRTENSGRTWRSVDFSRRTPQVNVLAVSCASLRLCVAVGGQNADTQKAQRNILVSNDAGGHWRSVPASPCGIVCRIGRFVGV